MDLYPNIKVEYITIHDIPHNLTVEKLIKHRMLYQIIFGENLIWK
jgi:hypothetical protein